MVYLIKLFIEVRYVWEYRKFKTYLRKTLLVYTGGTSDISEPNLHFYTNDTSIDYYIDDIEVYTEAAENCSGECIEVYDEEGNPV